MEKYKYEMADPTRKIKILKKYKTVFNGWIFLVDRLSKIYFPEKLCKILCLCICNFFSEKWGFYASKKLSGRFIAP